LKRSKKNKGDFISLSVFPKAGDFYHRSGIGVAKGRVAFGKRQ
jgi:hypothetical protein